MQMFSSEAYRPHSGDDISLPFVIFYFFLILAFALLSLKHYPFSDTKEALSEKEKRARQAKNKKRLKQKRTHRLDITRRNKRNKK